MCDLDDNDELSIYDEYLISNDRTYRGSHKSSILTDLNREREENESYCDVILRVDGTEFKAHKCILGKLSLFFDKMFKAELKQNYDSAVNMDGINATTLQTILQYMYKGDITLTSENGLDLLAASNYLQMAELKRFCVHYVCAAVSIYNCLYLRTQGQTYNCPRLCETADNYLKRNFNAVSQRPEFKSLSKIDLISIIRSLNESISIFEVKYTYEGTLIWVKCDLGNRRKNFRDIFDVLRLDLLPTSYLNEVVAKEDLVKASLHCMEFLNDELQFRKIGANKHEGTKKNKFVLISNKTVKLFDLFTKLWKRLPNLPTSGEGSCVASYKNCLYVIGGCNLGNAFTPGAQHNDPTLIQCLDLNNPKAFWTVVGHTKHVRSNSKAAVLNDTIMICSSGNKVVEIFRPNSKCSINESKMNVACSTPVLTKHKGILYCCNGGNQTATRYVNDAWDSIENMKYRFDKGSAVGLNDEIFLIGTNNYRQMNNQSYNVKHKEWRRRGISSKFEVFDTLAFDDHIYVFGRNENTFEVSKFDPRTDSWETCFKEEVDFQCSIITAI